MTSRLAWTTLIAVSLALTSPARAEDEAASRAARWKRDGDAAMESGRPAEALAAYREAHALSKEPALLYNMGRARMALTDYPRALDDLEAFEREATPELRDRVRGLPRILEELRGKVTRVTVRCPRGALVRLRDRTIGTCPIDAPVVVVAGRGTIEVLQDDHVPWRRDVDLPGGGDAAYNVTLVRRAPAGGDEARSSGLVSQWWFWAGVAVVLAGGVAVAVAATTEAEPRAGTVPPGVVAGGLRGATLALW